MKRLRLFLRDWIGEWGIAWSIARTNDCERNGGHRWGVAKQSHYLAPFQRDCSRCGCSELVAQTTVTVTGTNWMTATLNSTSG